jgi:nucleoside-diphosphate-sugar epimerase
VRVFVTGATGFIGHHLCHHLIERGDQVVALVRTPAKASRLPKDVEIVKGDLSILSDTGTVLPPCDVVVHLAGLVAADKLRDYEAINFFAVRDLLGCIERQTWRPKRLLLASSLAAAGPSAPGHPWTEDDVLRPIEPYGMAKARAEIVVREAPYPTTSFRPPLVFGPGDEATLTFFKAASAGVGLRVSGAPQQLSFVDVRDLVDAIVRMAEDRRAGSFVYYTSHAERMDLPELWRALGQVVGRRVRVLPIPRSVLYVAMLASTIFSKIFRNLNRLDSKQYRQMVAPAFVCSSDKLTSELGWTARYDLVHAVTNAAEEYRKAGLLSHANH